MFSAQRRWPHLRELTRSQTCPPCPPTAKTSIFVGFARCRGCRGCKGCWNTQMLLMQECRAGKVCGDAKDVGGDAGDCPGRFSQYLQCFLKVGQRGIRSPSQGQGGRGCFGVQVFGPACVQVMQATLRRSLGCNKTRQRVGLPSLFGLKDTQHSWTCLALVVCCLLFLVCDACCLLFVA